MFESFIKGTLYQVAKETYGLKVTFPNKQKGTSTHHIVYQSTSNLNDIKFAKADHAMQIVRKCQIIPFEGIKKIFYIKQPISNYHPNNSMAYAGKSMRE